MSIGIPTKYDGLNFRSRLEAKWAHFFDLLGWRWEYEPFDLDGYIPDFILTFPHDPILVEVKPSFKKEELYQHTEKIDKSGWKGEAIIVGARLFTSRYFGTASLGLLKDVGFYGEPKWGDSVIFKCKKCNETSICHDECSYSCRFHGCYDGDHYVDFINLLIPELWKEATNRTQWKPRAKN